MKAKIICGPATCQGCGELVAFAFTAGNVVPCWRDAKGMPHICRRTRKKVA